MVSTTVSDARQSPNPSGFPDFGRALARTTQSYPTRPFTREQTSPQQTTNITINGDVVHAHFPDDGSNSINIYYHIMNQFESLNRLSPVSNAFGWKIISNDSNLPSYGNCNPLLREIRIRHDVGQYSHVARHELSHAYVYDKLDNNWFNGSTLDRSAMDEAFAIYLPCSVINSPLDVDPNGISDIRNYTVYNAYPNSTIDEESYYLYYCGYAIASAWWEIRSRFVKS